MTPASSSPLRGIATARRWSRPATPADGPHRPYEGLQPSRRKPVQWLTAPVLIAPTRDCNMLMQTSSSSPGLSPHRPYEGLQRLGRGGRRSPGAACPHRPYEGLQQRTSHGRRPHHDAWSSSPLRGIATGPCRPAAPVRESSSSPLRGIATSTAPRTGTGSPRWSSSPLRGIATHSYSCRLRRRWKSSSSPLRGIATLASFSVRVITQTRSSSPLRGIATRRDGRSPSPAVRGPHRPYEGLQLQGGHGGREDAESSSPLRGIATQLQVPLISDDQLVLIAPTRDCNDAPPFAADDFVTRPHRPYEGLQHHVRPDLEQAIHGPHRPYEGLQHDVQSLVVAQHHPRPHRPYEGLQPVCSTCGYTRSACPHRPYEGLQRVNAVHTATDATVLIAPTRDCNR